MKVILKERYYDKQYRKLGTYYTVWSESGDFITRVSKESLNKELKRNGWKVVKRENILF